MSASGPQAKEPSSEGSGCTPTDLGRNCSMRCSIAKSELSATFPALASGYYAPRLERCSQRREGSGRFRAALASAKLIEKGQNMLESGLPIRVYKEHGIWHVDYGEGE